MKISDLVQKYHNNRDTYLGSTYNETQVRTDFLDPLFEILGWDIKNSEGKATNEREVLLEEALRADVNTNTKKPDYTFRLFSERKFFLEAKKPSVQIDKNPEPAKQVRKYGFTAKLKISVLSNFEYLAIYDCSKPINTSDSVSFARIKIYHYTQYEDFFDEIQLQLSKEVVYNGQFDEYWKEIEAKLKRSSVDHLFLKQINEWRLTLGKEIHSHKNDIGEDVLNDLVQRYINSIIFLRVCEDRNIEIYKSLLSLAENENHNALIQKFKDSDRKYNAGLFNHPLTEEIITNSNSAFWDIIKELYFPLSTYSFSVFASDILGNIYEVFLGEQLKIINGLIYLKKKPENIDRDIVTTPTYIIQDILRETLAKHCQGKTDQEIINSSFADIACGSGAFLLETFQLLNDTLIDFYLDYDKNELIKTGVDTYKLKFETKSRLLTNCIYGIDKDYNAVEACKFGLLLKLLENEDNNSLPTPALPSLDANICYGNSLLNSSITPDNEVNTINPYDFGDTKFDVIVGNPPYMATEHIKRFTPLEEPLYTSKYITAHKQFDKYFLFIERGLELLKPNGFLGYIVPSKFTKVGAGLELRKLLVSQDVIYKIISFGAIQLFKDKTTYSSLLILSKKKNETFEYTEIKQLHEWKARDSKNIITDNIQTAKLSSELWFIVPPFLKNVYERIISQSDNLETIVGKKNINNGIQTSANDVLVIKPIDENTDYVFFEKKGVEFKIEKAILKPYYETVRKRGEDRLYTYRELIPNSYVIFPYILTDSSPPDFITMDKLETEYPLAYSYLSANKERLLKRDIQPTPKTQDEWYRMGRSQYLELGKIKEKIIIGVNSQGNKYPVDLSQTLHTAGGTAGYCSIFLSDDSPYSIYYIQAILNSKYLEWIISLRGEVFRGGYIARGTKVLKDLPIRTINFNDPDEKSAHDTIVLLQKALIQLQSQIDQNKNNLRALTPLERQFKNKKADLDTILKSLYNLGQSDNLIPLISELYATH